MAHLKKILLLITRPFIFKDKLLCVHDLNFISPPSMCLGFTMSLSVLIR